MIEIGGEQLLPAEVKRLCSGFPAGAFLDDAIGVGGPDVEGTGFVAGALRRTWKPEPSEFSVAARAFQEAVEASE